MTKIFKGNCKKCGLISDDRSLYKTRGNCKNCSNLYFRKYMSGKYIKVDERKPRDTSFKVLFRENMPINLVE